MNRIKALILKKDKNYLEQAIVFLPILFVVRTFFYGLYQVPSGSMETTMLVGERFLADKLSPWIWPIQRGDIISFNDPLFEYSDNTLKNLFERYVWGPSNWTKRVIGLPGEHIEGKINAETGKTEVYVNGVKLEEPYVNKYPLIAVESYRPQYMFDFMGQKQYVTQSYDPALPFDKQPFYRIDVNKIVGYPNNMEILQPGTPMRYGNDMYDIYLGENEYWVMGDNRLGSADSRSWGPLDGKLIHGKIKFRMLSIDLKNPWLIVDLLTHPIDFWTRIRFDRCFQTIS
jgi:signal peptidase I